MGRGRKEEESRGRRKEEGARFFLFRLSPREYGIKLCKLSK